MMVATEIRKTLAADISAGMSYRQISSKYGVSYQRIGKIAREMGLKSDGAKAYSAEKAELGRRRMKKARPRIARLLKKGESLRAIATTIGVDYRSVRDAVQKMRSAPAA